MKTVFTFICLIITFISAAQPIAAKLAAAIRQLETDEQFKHAILSLYVVDGKTGKLVYDKNGEVGLAPASCQKVITSVSAFEILGKDYRYKTEIGFDGNIKDSILNGNLIFTGYGDPTLASWRWKQTSDEEFKNQLNTVLKKRNVRNINGNIVLDESKWESQATPGGWVWEDVGNYYGAGARAFNWHENQYDLILKPGKKEGAPVEILETKPPLEISVLINELKTGKEGSGDNSIIYLPEDGLIGFVRGTVPAGKETFTVAGSVPNATGSFAQVIENILANNNIKFDGRTKSSILYNMNKEKIPVMSNKLAEIYSQTLDSINYWFLKKSINLYGEAFVKAIAYEKIKFGSTDSGIKIIKNFWKANGIEPSAINIMDGSGLSPANRVTTHALVTVLQFAKDKKWFPSFYYALPDMNGIKMKDGYIGGVRSFTGYVNSKVGQEYIFSFIVNNFDGNASSVREKMWKLLDILK